MWYSSNRSWCNPLKLSSIVNIWCRIWNTVLIMFSVHVSIWFCIFDHVWFVKCVCVLYLKATMELKPRYIHTYWTQWFRGELCRWHVRKEMKCLIRERMGTRRAWAEPGPLLTCPSSGEARKQGHDGRKGWEVPGVPWVPERRWNEMGS